MARQMNAVLWGWLEHEMGDYLCAGRLIITEQKWRPGLVAYLL